MDIDAFFLRARPLIEKNLDALLPSHSAEPYAGLFEAARYALFSGGKRLRPLLVLASAYTLSGSWEKMQEALDPACALECIHTYSLIHDDLPCMDDDDLRRGKPTLHRVYPEWHALLTGDYLLTFAFEVISKSVHLNDAQKIALIHTLSNRSGAQGMIGGQMIDLLSEGCAIDLARLEQMHAHKTAALISAALECGAIVADANENDRALMRQCGETIGIAFQITDDILDAAEQDTDKATAVTLLGSAQATQLKKDLLTQALQALHSLSRPAPLLESLFYKLVERNI